MATTRTAAVEIPRQWAGSGAPASRREAEWDATMEEVIMDLLPSVCDRLVEAANGRAIGAYDYGVAWGIGQLPEADTDAPTEVIFAAVQAAMERFTALTAVLNERIQ
jgi:hypothetical protein